MSTIETSPAFAVVSAATPTYRPTQKRTSKPSTHYSVILKQIKEAGLLKKVPSFYVTRLLIITSMSLLLWGALAAAAVLLPFWSSVWVGAAVMVLQGVCAAQYGFIAHEASHRQVFENNRWNDNLGRVLANLFAGLSYGFWMKKHNKHHAKPNQIGEDPDINIRVLSFTPESVEEKKGVEKLLTRNQGWLFPVFLLFTSFDLLFDSVVSVTRKDKPVKYRVFEFSMMMVRQVTPFIVAWLLFGNVLVAAALWVAMMLSFGFFMGFAFAPNHKGMPLVEKDTKLGFFERQVLTSRNIRSSWWTDNFMGGLNFQVEHHLFPSMARPYLTKAHKMVVEYCETHNVKFTEMGVLASYAVIIKYLNKVGLSNNISPFVCPMVAELRPRH